MCTKFVSTSLWTKLCVIHRKVDLETPNPKEALHQSVNHSDKVLVNQKDKVYVTKPNPYNLLHRALSTSIFTFNSSKAKCFPRKVSGSLYRSLSHEDTSANLSDRGVHRSGKLKFSPPPETPEGTKLCRSISSAPPPTSALASVASSISSTDKKQRHGNVCVIKPIRSKGAKAFSSKRDFAAKSSIIRSHRAYQRTCCISRATMKLRERIVLGISISAVLFTLLLVMDLQMDTGYSGQHLVYPSHGRVKFGGGENIRNAYDSFQKRFLQKANASHVPSKEISNSLNLFGNVVRDIENRPQRQFNAPAIDQPGQFEAPGQFDAPGPFDVLDSANYHGDRNDLNNRRVFQENQVREQHDNFNDLNDFLINNPVSAGGRSGRKSGAGVGGDSGDSGPLEDPIIVVSEEDSELDNPTLQELLGLELPVKNRLKNLRKTILNLMKESPPADPTDSMDLPQADN
ncbi:hypothetical protein M8J76_011869 [Diaphorina citri]|nr:hypothetical protein M8J76_011869 [Diaphorina citri]